MSYHPAVNYFLTIILIISLQSCNKQMPPDENISGKRIISLSPSITGEIIDLGGEDNIVGVTPYHPPLKKKIPLVGSYINPSIEKIIKLKPDIILMSEEDGEIQRNSFFEKFGLKYYRFRKNSDFKSICDNYSILAGMIGRGESGREKIEYYKSRLRNVKRDDSKLKVVFLVSVKPLITVSKQSHISDIISEAGGINVFADLNNPYPILTMESLVVKNPDIVIIMSQGEDVYLYNQLKKFRNINFLNRKNIVVSGDEIIPYYSPKEYVLSVEKISEILRSANK